MVAPSVVRRLVAVAGDVGSDRRQKTEDRIQNTEER
jgi:hypothetical protein